MLRLYLAYMVFNNIAVTIDVHVDKENLSRGHGKDRESWTRGKTC